MSAKHPYEGESPCVACFACDSIHLLIDGDGRAWCSNPDCQRPNDHLTIIMPTDTETHGCH